MTATFIVQPKVKFQPRVIYLISTWFEKNWYNRQNILLGVNTFVNNCYIIYRNVNIFYKNTLLQNHINVKEKFVKFQG